MAWDTIEAALVEVHEYRKTAEQVDWEAELTDEEFAVVCFAIGGYDNLLKKARWSVIKKLMDEGILIEVWLPMGGKRDSVIRAHPDILGDNPPLV